MKIEDVALGTRVALVEKKNIKCGKVITLNSVANKGSILIIEWDSGALTKMDVSKLVAEADVMDQIRETKAKEAVKKAEAAAKKAAKQARIDSFEKEFKEVFDKINPEIQSKLEQAAQLISEATSLSEKHGIPFRLEHGIPFQMSYIPDSLEKFFPALKEDENWDLHEKMCKITGSYDCGEYSGWQSSQTC